MSFSSRINNGWTLAMTSFSTIQKNPSLLLFPVFSVISLVMVLATFAGGSFFLFGDEIQAMLNSENEQVSNALGIIAIFLYYLINYFIIVYFNAALIFCASKILNGEESSLGEGISFANDRIGKIFGWAVMAATVGTLLQLLHNTGKIGKFVSSLLGAAWSVLTFFVVPVLIFEDKGVVDSVKESWRLIKEKWGESLVANVSFGLFHFLGIVIAIGLGLLLCQVHIGLGIIVGVLIVLVTSTVAATAQTIFVAAAYNRITGRPTGNFDGPTLDSVFVQK